MFDDLFYVFCEIITSLLTDKIKMMEKILRLYRIFTCLNKTLQELSDRKSKICFKINETYE